jgi:hypothetical protein
MNNWYFFLCCLFLFFILVPKNILKKHDFQVFSLSIFLIIIGIFLRPLTFSDDENYLSMLKKFNFTDPNDLGKISSLFYYLNLFFLFLFNDFNLILKLNFVLIWIIIWSAFQYENVKNKSLSLIFLFFIFQVLFFIQLRNAFAIAFLCWALLRYFNKKSSFLLLTISILFHYSVIPFVFCFFLVEKFFKKTNNISIYLFFFISIGAFILSNYFYELYFSYIVILPFFETYFTDFISTPEVGNTSYFQLLLLFFHLLLANNIYKSYFNNNLVVYKYVILIFLGLLLGIFFSPFPLFQRLIVPFYLFAIISFFFQFRDFIKTQFQSILYLGTIFIYLTIALNRLYFFDNWYIF